jgi:hypothetical protein
MVIITVAATIFATSAFAQSARTERSAPRVHDPMLGYNASDRTVVSVAGAYVGRDPDPTFALSYFVSRAAMSAAASEARI